MVYLVEGLKLGHSSSPIAHPSSEAAQDHVRTRKLLTATLGYNNRMLIAVQYHPPGLGLCMGLPESTFYLPVVGMPRTGASESALAKNPRFHELGHQI